MHRITKHREGPNDPAEMKCDCGATIVLYDPMDNYCDNCDRCYNSSGQSVTPSYQCDETGVPYADYIDF